MKWYVPVIVASLLFAGCTQAAQQSETQSIQQPAYRQVSMEEAISLMESETEYVILDVRTASEFAENHIPGAVNIPNETIGSDQLPELPHKDQLILVYCRSGNRSKQASRKLAELGYRNVVEFGGINSWPGDVVSGDS